MESATAAFKTFRLMPAYNRRNCASSLEKKRKKQGGKLVSYEMGITKKKVAEVQDD
jgi:hypothetical protein